MDIFNAVEVLQQTRIKYSHIFSFCY